MIECVDGALQWMGIPSCLMPSIASLGAESPATLTGIKMVAEDERMEKQNKTQSTFLEIIYIYLIIFTYTLC